MEFVSHSPIVPGSGTGVVFVKYMILEGDGDGKKQLKLYEKDAGFLKEEDVQSQRDEALYTLISGIQDLQFEYLKGNEDKSETDWQASWDPSEEKGLPLAVKIVLKQDEETAPINLIVPIWCQEE